MINVHGQRELPIKKRNKMFPELKSITKIKNTSGNSYEGRFGREYKIISNLKKIVIKFIKPK